jgi:hypothetical protein
MSEIAAIRQHMPSVKIHLWSFHASTAVKRALKSKNVPPTMSECLQQLFKQQKSYLVRQEYDALKEKMTSLSPPDVKHYFENSWWNDPSSWAASFSESPCFHLTTTNHAESYHQKLKRTLSSKSSLSFCINHLLHSGKLLIQTRSASSIIDAISFHYNSKHSSATISEIQNHLTPFASRLVAEQLVVSEQITYNFEPVDDEPGMYSVQATTEGSRVHKANDCNCDCEFFYNFALPDIPGRGNSDLWLLWTEKPRSRNKLCFLRAYLRMLSLPIPLFT